MVDGLFVYDDEPVVCAAVRLDGYRRILFVVAVNVQLELASDLLGVDRRLYTVAANEFTLYPTAIMTSRL